MKKYFFVISLIIVSFNQEVFAYSMLSVNDLKNKLFTDAKNVFYEQEVSTTSRKERLGKDEK